MAATGTPTPNIGLRIPLGTDPASVDDINYNSNLIDTKLGAVGNDSVQDQLNDLNSNTSKKDFDVFYSYQVRDIENALLVDLTNIQGNNNRVGLVRGTTTNKPSDCSFGLRQVYAFSPTQVFVIIIGVSTDTKFNIWCNFYNVSAWEGWKKVSFS